jgi:hypothetical protein
MQMLSQLSYRPVPRIIPNHGKPRDRTMPRVSAAQTTDLDPMTDLDPWVGAWLDVVPEAGADRSTRRLAVARSLS